MENRIFLQRYRLSLGRNGLPVEMHRAPGARTYRAHEIETGREIALTIASPAPDDLELLEKLETQATAAEKINHINIPRLYDFGRENDELIYVNEYCEGHTASAWVEARGRLTIAAVLRVALQIADAMNATVFQSLYHPALNPDNILFVAGQTGEGDWPPIKILNWYGPRPLITQPADARAENAARFAAPEQLGNGKVDVRSEIYSLGATMWFLITGMTPAVDDPGGLRLATSRLRGVPKIVRHLLERMVQTNPLARPQDPVALASYLQTCVGRAERRTRMERRFGIPLTTQPRVAAPRTRIPISLKSLAVAVAILLLAALVVLFLPQSSTSRRSSQSASSSNRLKSGEPNQTPMVKKDSRERTNRPGTSSPPVEVAAAPQASSDELISIAPSSSSIPSPNDALPGKELAITGSGQAASEPSTPEEGPSERDEEPLANHPEIAPLGNSSSNELTSDATVAPPHVMEPDKPHPSAVVATPSQVADSALTQEAKAKPTGSQTVTPRKMVLAKHAAKSPEVDSSRDKSDSHVLLKRARSVRTVKRARRLPPLRVGSAPAELVGTTRNGDWVLFVEDTGERIIVPPPPGYGP